MDVNELLSNETKKLIAADLQKEVDRQIKDYPIRIKIDGVLVDPWGTVVKGGEIEIEINKSEVIETITDEQYLAVSDRAQLLVNLDEFYPGEIGAYVKEVYND